jgi:mono/diheme cytochrome c family protein
MTLRHLSLAAGCGALAAALACSTTPADTQLAASTAPPASAVERGAYLVNSMGCHDCHTPWKMGPNGPEPDMTRALSGHPENVQVTRPAPLSDGWMFTGSATNTAWAGPWGISFTANITSDQNTGLGIWTEDMFLRAIREGKHMATSRPILPPMPWPMIRNLNDDDLKAMFAYLKSTPPITNHVPEPITPEDLANMK